MKLRILCSVFACFAVLAIAATAEAQCTTSPAPTVAYQQVQPVAYQPAVAYAPRAAWYPGRWLDELRLRRWGYGATTAVATPAAPATYGVGYAAGYAPVAYQAAYAPNAYTVGYRPYLTPYAPLRRTAYYPVVQAVARPVVLSPASDCGCSYQPSDCSNCAVAAPSPASVGSATPQPTLEHSDYDVNRPVGGSGNLDPGPASDSSTLLEAPSLLELSDRTARRAVSHRLTVGVTHAVYRKSGEAKTQAEVDAVGWSSVPRG